MFIAPDSFVPRVTTQFQHDLDVKRIQGLGPDDIAIALTPEGTTFVDVLSSEPKQVSKSGKDHDTLKWEEELRADLAKKRGQQQKKLTAEEQSRVNAQLAKEADIRRKVHGEKEILSRGAGIVLSLAKSAAPIDAEVWINTAIRSLFDLARAGAGALVGDAVAHAYVALSNRISMRLGDVRPFIGIATLRCTGKTYLRAELEEEHLGSKDPALFTYCAGVLLIPFV